jgi:hypothetical protein
MSAQGKTDKCVAHGGGKQCIVEGCPKSAKGKTDKCIEHGVGKRCIVEGCRMSAQGKTDKCKAHGGGLRCPKCIDWPDSRSGNPYYDGWCARCFRDQWPKHEKLLSKPRVEHQVRLYLNSHFPDFVHDHAMETKHCVCTNRHRIDHRRLIGNTLLCVETDEKFHRYYDQEDEDARYHDTIMDWEGKLCFLRFNPDKFNLDDRYNHGPPLVDLLERLRAEVTRQICLLEREENNSLLEVWYLYYPKGVEDYTSGI